MLLVVVCYLLMIHFQLSNRYLKFYFKYFLIITFTLRNESGLESRY